MQRADHLAPLLPDALYPLPVLMRFCGLTHKSWDAARRNGLVAHRAGKRVFVLGSDFIHWVVNHQSPIFEQSVEAPPPAPVQPLPASRPKAMMNRTEAAEYLAIRPQTLAVWAITRKGPRMVRLGRSVRYRLEDLDDFVRARVIGSRSSK